MLGARHTLLTARALLPRAGVSLSRAASSASSPPKKDTVKALAQRISLKGETVLVRADLNLPLSKGEGPPQITDATRLIEALPTLRVLIDAGAKVVVCSHLGRPKKAKDEAEKARMKLAPIAQRMSEELGFTVPAVDACIGPSVTAAVGAMKDGGVILLENTRFHKEEEKNEPGFAAELVKSCGATVFVNDAFGAAHRAHASTAGVVPHVKHAVAGMLLEKELDFLYGAVAAAERPFAAVVGGAKVSSKIAVLESLMEKVDTLVVGGGMAFTFLKARGLEVGKSLVEDDQLELATKLEAMAKAKGVEMILPIDVVAADAFAADAKTKIVSNDAIPADYLGVDNGPETTKMIQDKLSKCKTVIWNGPMGVFEMAPFSHGTFAVAETLAAATDAGCVSIIGGGDSVAAVNKAGLASRMSHISTGGGASLELLEGKVLPGVDQLDDA